MNEADQHLLKLASAGDHDGWQQFVARFQKRLMAFAIRQVDQHATAEDLVQETFVAFLNAMSSFRQQCELESFLFQILRRRIVDHYRRQGRNREIPVCAFPSSAEERNETVRNPLQQASAVDMHASWYARRNEASEADQQILSAAIRQLTEKLQSANKFRELKIAEGLFFAGRRNQELAVALSVPEGEIALVKHRLVKRLTQFVSEAETGTSVSLDVDFTDAHLGDLLTIVWESQRPSCPKRTTLGKFTLGILPPEWDDFLNFHVRVLGCTYCLANLDELSLPEDSPPDSDVQQRLFTSTIGFLRA